MVAVTGASGHVGANLVRLLVNEGREVRALVREDRRALQGLDVTLTPGDVLDLPSLNRSFEGVRIVFHLAASISMYRHDAEKMYRVNVEGTTNVIKACLECGVERLVHFSSIHTLSPYPREEVIDEARPLLDESRLTPYDRSKALAEKEVLKAVKKGLDAVIICPTAIIGPYDYKPSYAGKTLCEIYRGNIPALVDGGFNWVDVRDVVKGTLAASEEGRPGERYIFSGAWRSVSDVCELVGAVTGCDIPNIVVPMWLARSVTPPMTLVSRMLGRSPMFTKASLYVLRHYKYISHAKATRELGYKPRPLEHTIRDIFSWFKEHGYL
jgi:dihydroflavonol-4-reductase